MHIRSLAPRAAAAALLFGLATPAFAHPGHGEGLGFVGGLLHPFTGIDHLAAMLMVGLWAAQLPIAHKWLGATAFVAAMIVGFASAALGGAFGAELVIGLSLASLPVLIVAARRLPLVPQFACVALFGFGHGFAHGQESGSHVLAFAGGMIIATALLHGLGLWAGGALLRRRTALVA